MQRIVRIFAWLCLLAILVATLSPIQFRPSLADSANMERFAAFFFVGLIFSLAYPRQWLTVIVLTIGSAGLFEVLQRLIPGRHGELIDFLIKAAGGLTGVIIARLLRFLNSCRTPH